MRKTLLYSALIAFVSALMLWAWIARSVIEISVIPDRNPLYVVLSDGSIRNTYTIKALNKTREPHRYALVLQGLHGAGISVAGADGEIAGDEAIEIAARPDSVATYRIHVRVPRERLHGESTALRFVLRDKHGRSGAAYESVFLGPGR